MILNANQDDLQTGILNRNKNFPTFGRRSLSGVEVKPNGGAD